MPIYVQKKIVGGQDEFYGKVNQSSSINIRTIEDLSSHPQPSVQVYILNDGSSPSATLTVTFLYRLVAQWRKALRDNILQSYNTGTSTLGDLNKDGVVDVLDAAIFAATSPTTPIFRFFTWQVSTDDGVSYQDLDTGIDLFNSGSWKLVLNNLTIADNGKKYRCVVGLQDYTIISKEAELLVNYLPDLTDTNSPVTISSHPNDTIASNDGIAEFSVSASSSDPEISLQYQWQVSINNGFSFTNVPSGTSPTLSLSSLTREDHNKIYRVRVYRPNPPGLLLPIAYSSIFSKHARLLTQAEFDIISHPQTTSSTDGSAQFSVVIAPTFKIIFSANYQWQVSKDNGISYADISGATGSVLNLSGLLINDHNSLYRVKISSACCGTETFIRYSNSARLYTVNTTIVFEKQPVSLSSINSEVTFTANVRSLCPLTCGPILYQWAYVTETSADPIYTIIDGETLDYLIVNVITNDKQKFALIASQPQTNSIIISNTVTLTNLNNKPTDIFLSKASILEGNSVNDIIGTLSTQDLNAGGTYTYSLLTEFPDYVNFSIDNTTKTLKAATSFDYDTQSSHTIGIRSTDQGGLYVDKIFYIYVRINVELLLGNTIESLPENTSVSSDITVAEIRIKDPFDGEGYLSEDDIFLFGANPLSLTGTDANFFKIEGLSLKLKSGTALNFETKSTYTVTVVVTPQPELSDPDSATYVLTIDDVNEGPTNIVLFPASILEKNKVNDLIGNFISIDADINQTFSYSLVTNSNPALSADNNAFTIPVGTNTLLANSIFDWNTKRIYKITVRTTDSGTPARTYDKALEILIIKRPSPPPQPPQPPKPPDTVSGDPHYFIKAYSGKKYSSIIDDNIGGDPTIGMYVKISNEEWKAVFTNTPGIVCSLASISYYYRAFPSTTWEITDQRYFNINGCFIISGGAGYANFFWNNPYELIKRAEDLTVGGFLYWLQKGIEANSNQSYDLFWPNVKGFSHAIGIDGITEVVSQFGLKRDDFLASAGDSNLFKITEKFNIFSDKVTS